MNVEDLVRLGSTAGPEKTLRTYAYLTASLNNMQGVRDVLDCLTPFVVAIATKDPSKPIFVPDLAAGLKTFGLEIPYYALEQLLPRLQADGVLEWNAALHAHLVTPTAAAKVSTTDLPGSFIDLEEAIATFARSNRIEHPTVSDTWGDALIRFFKDDYDGISVRPIDVKGTKIGETGDIEAFVVARFIQNVKISRPDLFDKVVEVYCGALIEDFIGNIQSIGQDRNYGQLTILYDTSVLLRLLGTSGALLQDATLEMHHTLQSLGTKTFYLSSTDGEVTNILDTLSAQIARGYEIFGETSDAIISGEITSGKIKALVHTHQSVLATLNIFAFNYDYGARKMEDRFQIDEIQFSELLKEGARKNDRGYSFDNALNDAGAVAMVLRLRRSRSSHKVGDAHYIFVSRNSLLQRTARRYAVDHTGDYDNGSVPPVLTTGQITTAAWLAESRKLEPRRVTKELLAACYAAIQPDKEWADEFAKAISDFRAEDPGRVLERANASIVLQNIRYIARDETFNEPAALKKINLAEFIRSWADKLEQERQREEAQTAERIRTLAVDAEKDKNLAVAQALNSVEIEVLQNTLSARKQLLSGVAAKISRAVIAFIQISIVVAFAVSLFVTQFFLDILNPVLKISLIIFLSFVTILSALDLFGFPVARRYSDKLVAELSRRLERLLG
jgi:hypothetical protein